MLITKALIEERLKQTDSFIEIREKRLNSLPKGTKAHHDAMEMLCVSVGEKSAYQHVLYLMNDQAQT